MTEERRFTREEWAEARRRGRLYPDSPDGEWIPLSEITAELVAGIAAARQEAAE